MRKGINARKTVFTGLVIVAACTLFFTCKFSFAEDKRPKKGTVEFGAAQKPDIKVPSELKSFRNIFSSIADAVIPTVVSITSTRVDTVVYRDPFHQFFWNSPFDDFFGTPRKRQQEPQKKQEERRTSGFGSGVIVSKDGYILTNYHVVGDADEIVVETADEREFEATIVGVDSLSDVAVIKVSGDVSNLPVAYLGDSDKLTPGDWVMAVGNPFNLSSTVTTGIVSAMGRYTGGITTYQNFIQTDAAINPGNSGGALVNIDGELIGINTMIYTRSGGYMGIGFAIPINMAKTIMEQLIYKGEVARGWLGVQIGDIDQSMKDALGLKSKKGVLINDVFEGEPADKAGLKAGDVVLSIDGIRVGNANELKNTVASIAPGKKVPLKIIRDGKATTLSVVLTKRDEEKIGKMTAQADGETDEQGEEERESDIIEKVGFKVGSLTSQIREKLNLSSKTKGVVVLEVNPSSWAARKGIRKYDIIHKVKVKGNKAVAIRNTKEFARALKGAKSGTSIMLYVEREGNSFFVAFKLE
jgi:serine protease Do